MTDTEESQKAAALQAAKPAQPRPTPVRLAPAPKPAPAEPQKVVPRFQAVHGLLVHPFTRQRFEVAKPVEAEPDGWILDQVAANKLREVLA